MGVSSQEKEKEREERSKPLQRAGLDPQKLELKPGVAPANAALHENNRPLSLLR